MRTNIDVNLTISYICCSKWWSYQSR